MSIMNFLEAINFVLESEMERQEHLMILRPGARRALDESDREIALPHLGDASFSIALGAAMSGLHPVLDLRHEEDQLALLIDALAELPSGLVPDLTIIVDAADADGLIEHPDLRLFHPENPRQAAGLMRSALRNGGMTLFVADLALSDLTDDVPDDPDFMLLPLDDADDVQTNDNRPETGQPDADEPVVPGPEAAAQAAQPSGLCSDEPEAESTPPFWPCADEEEFMPSLWPHDDEEVPTSFLPDEEPMDSHIFPETEPDPQPASANALPCWAMRQVPVCLDRLNRLNDELEAPDGLIVRRLLDRLDWRQRAYCWQHEPGALPGECAFLPPERAPVCLWLGNDMLSITYDAVRFPHEEATSLLREARRLLENPALLIYDKERDLP